VKNGAELLDRLIKDIVSESAATYVSVIHGSPGPTSADDQGKSASDQQTAFSLERFLPLLEERINVLNPFTRTFLVAWITLLDSIPDLELVAYLPRFLGGLFKFLSDQNQDVHTATQVSLDRFLGEIRKIARIKQGIAESKKSQGDNEFKRSTSSTRSGADVESEAGSSIPPDQRESPEEKDDRSLDSGSVVVEDEKSASGDGDWIPGQDVHVDHPKILEILVTFLGAPFGDKGTARPRNELLSLLTIYRGRKPWHTAHNTAVDR
jgi:vacuole morphology and inheritance protein 14